MIYSFEQINEMILMFVISKTHNKNLIVEILDYTNNLVNEWTEFELDNNNNNNNIEYLSKMKSSDIKTILPSKDCKKKRRIHELNNDKQTIDSYNESITKELYKYTEKDVEKEANQLLRAISLLITVSRCLPPFGHMMLREDKEKLLNILFSLPNKIFFKRAKFIDHDKKSFIDLIKEINENSDFSNKKEDDEIEEEALLILQWYSSSLLLALYDIVRKNAYENDAKENFVKLRYIETELTKKIEHAVIMRNDMNFDDFYNYMDKLYDSKTSPFTESIIKKY